MARTTITLSFAILIGLLTSIALAEDQPRFTPPPPAEESETIKTLIDEAAAELRDHPENVSEMLCSPKYMSAHEWPRFRKLIEEHAPTGELAICDKREPGQALMVTCAVVDPSNKPVPGAMVYLYQTSAKGWYSDRAPHISGNSGDHKHARLFGYVKTDDTGTFKLSTRRPGGYPRSDLPQHIHIHIKATDEKLSPFGSEILFEDDPRLSQASAHVSAKRDQFTIAPVEHRADGTQHVRVKFVLDAAKRDR